MYKPIYGICICHGKKRLLVVKSGLCKQGNDERKRNNKSNEGNGKLQRSSLFLRKLSGNKRSKTTSPANRISKGVFKKSSKRKHSGEKKVFTEIWLTRSHFSEVSETYLGEELNVWFMSHVLPKSIAPRLRLDPRNIILMTPDEHQIWENKKHTIRDNPKWKWIFELEEKLKIEYYNK